MKLFKKIAPLALVLTMVLSTFTPVLAAVDETQNIIEPGLGNTEVIYNQESSFGVTIPKKITLGTDKTSTYTVTVTGDISSDEIIFVVPDNSFNMKDQATTGTIKADVPATVEQDKTEWKFSEFETIGNGLVSAPGLTAGNWAGTFYFNVKFNDCNITVNATNENGENLNATATNIVGKEKDALLDKLVESELIAAADEVSALINVKSDNFDGIADTTFNVSDIAEEGEKVAILHYDTEKGIWELIGIEKVKEDGTVRGDFTSYSPVAFVKVKSDGSYSNQIHEPGLYDLDWNLLYEWDYLVSTSGNSKIKGGIQIYDSSPHKITKVWSGFTGRLVISDTITEIRNDAFDNCKLTEIVFPDTVTTMGSSAITSCPNLEKVRWSSGMITIPNSTFDKCIKLKTITNINKITAIQQGAFYGCTGLTTITIPKTVKTIGLHAFSGCDNLPYIYYEGTAQQWHAITKDNSWDYDWFGTVVYYDKK